MIKITKKNKNRYIGLLMCCLVLTVVNAQKKRDKSTETDKIDGPKRSAAFQRSKGLRAVIATTLSTLPMQ